jgi:TolB protein
VRAARTVRRRRGVALALALVVACGGAASARAAAAPAAPIPPGAAEADSLIREGETRFEHLWQLTFGGQNAEAYWSADGTKLIFQSTRDGWPCDQMYVMDMANGRLTRVSTGRGRTTCGYFYDQDRRVLFASTHLAADSCPPPPDYSKGYVWPLEPGYEIFTARPDGTDLKRLTNHPGYDAEATVSTDGKWIVYTSLDGGDLDLYKMRLDGGTRTRLTTELGYDGGAFFSRDGKWICWRRGALRDSADTTAYRETIARNQVRPTRMDLWVMSADGSRKRQVTDRPGASFAPYFTPDGEELIYSSNWENPTGRNFDLYLVDVKGGTPVPVTRDPTFDGFPMFSPDGHWLVFASNRGGKVRGETNLFLARWR